MPWICRFKVLTLLPLPGIAVSCWVSISMGLLNKTSSSILAFASPIVLTETVICGGCPNFIFLANCCWKTRKEKIKKVFILSAKRAKSGMCLFSTWKLHKNIQGNFWLWKRKKNQLEAPIAATQWPPLFFLPQSDQGQEFTAWLLILGDQLEFSSVLSTFANSLWNYFLIYVLG